MLGAKPALTVYCGTTRRRCASTLCRGKGNDHEFLQNGTWGAAGSARRGRSGGGGRGSRDVRRLDHDEGEDGAPHHGRGERHQRERGYGERPDHAPRQGELRGGEGEGRVL